MAPLLSYISFISVFLASVVAIQVSPNSTCAAFCLDHADGDPLDPAASTTNNTDIACHDAEYMTSSKGIKFKNCVDCLQSSQDSNDSESDIGWFIYNIRYAVDVCLYGFPEPVSNISSPCDINYACAPLKTALETGGLDDSAVNATYDYCSADNGKFNGSSVDSCVQCLQSSTDQVYVSNFLIALDAGCQQKPQAGHLLGLSGSLFVSEAVNITAPPSNETDEGVDDSQTMTTGAIVGIAAGTSLLFLGGSALFVAYYRKQKALEKEFNPDFHAQSGNRSVTPSSKGGFTAGDMRQTSQLADYELRAQYQYCNGNYYDKIEEELRSRPSNGSLGLNKPGAGHQSAIPTHPAYLPRAMSRNSNRTNRAPSPPRHINAKPNKPDSYALQAYLAAAEASEALRVPPPPPLGAPGGPKSIAAGASSRSARQPQVPSLTLPSVPRIRIPKRYSPPSIQVQAATPTDRPQDDDMTWPGPSISNPLSREDSRFPDVPPGASRRRYPSPDAFSDTTPLREAAGPIEQTVIDHRFMAGIHDTEIRTGKSSMFG